MTKIKKALLSVLCCFALIFCSAFVFTACTRADMTAYNITIDEAIQSGWVKVQGDAIAGEEITIVLTPDEGYELVPGSLKVNGKAIDGNKFIMPERNVNVTAKFKKINYAVNTGNIEHGTVDIEVSGQEIASGDSTEWGQRVTLTPVPEIGYECTGITVLNNGVQVLVEKEEEGNKWSFIMPKGNITIDATFSKVIHTLTKQAEHGSFTIPEEARYGDTVEVTDITPDPGYVFSKIIFNGNTITGTSFKMPDTNTTVQVVFEAVEYTVSKNNVDHASISLPKTKAYYGDTITVSVTPDEGYIVSAIKVNGVAISGNSFVVKGDSVVTVELTAIDYSITVNSSENGSIVPDKTTANVGDLIRLTVNPDATYKLGDLIIKNGDSLVARQVNGNTVTFTMPAGDVTISATFAQNVNEVKINPTENGNVSATPVNALEGAEVVLTVSPATGYKLKSLKVMFGETEIAVVDNKFTMPAGSVTISATFEIIDYQITEEGTTDGSFTVSKTTANYNDEITITVSPATGYELDQILIDEEEITGTTFKMPAKDVTVKVTFKAINYTITRVGTTEHGYFDVQREAKYGEEVVITEQNTETGYEAVFTVTCNGTPVTVTGNKFIMPAGDVTVSVSHTLILYSISVNEENFVNGSFTASKTTANYNAEITITVAPDDGCAVDSVYVTYRDENGEEKRITANLTSVENEYSFIMPAGNVKIFAVFVEPKAITIVSSENGRVTADKENAFAGEKITLTITPNEGCKLLSIEVSDGTTIEVTEVSETEYTFVMKKEEVTITPTFEKITYTITKNLTTNGSFDVKETATYGETVTITVTPATGYELDQILVDGEVISGNSFTMPAKNVAVSVTFKAISYTITKNSTTNGSFTVSKTTANYNDKITITVTPAIGYELDQILVDGEAISGNSFTMPANNVAVSVTFKIANYTITKNIIGEGVVNVKETATYGENVTVTATANTGYIFKSLKINNGAVETTETSTGVYTFIMPAEAVQVEVVFYYVLTASDIEYTTSGTDLTITKVTTDKTHYEIPSTFNIGGTTYSVTAIGNGSQNIGFYVVALILPNTLKTIGDSAFYNCPFLTSITIPNSVISIGQSAFQKCTKLTSITIPNSVTSIGQGAFADCGSLDSITIPNSVTSIGSSAFYCCTSLTSITIPSSVTSISDSAFRYCSGLTSIVVAEGNTKYNSGNGNCIIETETNTLILGCNNTIIPDSVTSIGERAFAGCKGLTSITIPSNVTSIGREAFFGCRGLFDYGKLKYVSRADGKRWLLGYYEETKPTGRLEIPNDVVGIADYAFDGCKGLTSITIPSSVTHIGNRAFGGCTSLTSVTIPSSVTSIGDGVFSGCSSLTSITIPSSVTSIGKRAFDGCTGLKSITIPNSVTSIGDYAFFGCTGLTSITIPESVTSIGENAFNFCSGLTSITFTRTTPPSIGRVILGNCTSLTTIYVPAGSKTAYETALAGSGFTGTIVEK